jgi:type I restriction enzyme, R subunit
VNKWLFNIDTVDKVLEHIMTRGQKVAGGDRLGKTIIFAKNQAHADFIQQRFDINYPSLAGRFARTITFKTEYAQSLIDDFSQKNKAPHIAISVDMLDTGIDIPEVVNLVFFKLVRSKTKFWQMVGRGTRLCPDLFAPGKDKEFFYIFDYCQNLEFFSQDPETTDGALGESLGKRLFKTRLELIAALDKQLGAESMVREGPISSETLRKEVAAQLRDEVAAMNLNNFIVRPQRRAVEKYASADAWMSLTNEALGDLANHVAGLPSEIEPEDEEAKRFDLLMLNLQLALLHSEPAFARLRDQVKAIAGLLEEKGAIPMVQAQMSWIQDIQTAEWWQDVTVPLLDQARKRLRLLVKLIEKQQRKPIYTDFEDQMGEEISFDLPGFSTPDSYERFRAKARQFLKAHEDHIAIQKLRTNEPLTTTDLAELERMLAESGIGTAEDVEKAKEESHGLGIFVRSLVGMDRQAAKTALAGFLVGRTLRANQIQFLDEIVNHLTEHGCMDATRLYESPYTDFSPQGVDGVFNSKEVDELISILDEVKKRAIA